MDNEIKKYTTAELDALTVHDLRIILSKLGGTPKLKNRREMMDEIIDIQLGKTVPQRSNRGRKPKFIRAEALYSEFKFADAPKNTPSDSHNESDDSSCRNESSGCHNETNGGYRNVQNMYTGYKYTSRFIPPDGDSNDERLKEGNVCYKKDGTLVESASSKVLVSDGTAEPSEKMVAASGVLEIMEGYGFLRTYDIHKNQPDFYVERQVIRKYALRTGDFVVGYAINKFDKSSLSVCEVLEINGVEVENFVRGTHFDDLTAIYPCEQIITETASDEYALRSIDLLSPIGKGQRGLIVAPPKTGKTTLLKKLACSIESKYPDIHLIVLLIDERPEEVTDFASIVRKAEVVSSTFDESPEKHIKFAEMYMERAKRLVECGKDVVILLDSITKLARAYNNALPSSGKTLSGGVDPQALLAPKKFFGAARNTRSGGSLTIISTALVETGSRMDDVIFEEFKGTGNMEIVLSRYLSERRIFPAIDIYKSGTRNDEYLFDDNYREGVYKLRRMLAQKDNAAEIFIEMLQKSENNDRLMERLDGWLKIING